MTVAKGSVGGCVLIQDAFDPTGGTLDEELNVRAHSAEVIAVAELVRSNSMLSEDETWINTELTFVARQVIKDTQPSSLRPDGSITFRQSGGEMHVGRARVRADYFFLFRTGEKYLVFIRSITRERNVIIGLVGFPFQITSDERLAPMMLSSGKPMAAASPLHGMSLPTVIGELIMRLRRDRKICAPV